ncbi:GEVED domain-containing protein [Larkinella sp.]|uniref:GEVED domain-containing protein n=1 Tax=Larkinella sp. TaxID=2034517 RepID=UPI003BA9D45C
MWLPSTPIHHPGLPATAHGRGYADLTRMTVVPLATSRWRVWTWVVGLLLIMAWTQRVQAQATITIAKKAQSETAGQQFGFTSTIPGGSTFNLTDNAAFIGVQDVGVGVTNRVWVVAKPTSGVDGLVYYRNPGSTNWTATTIFANKIDVDQNGTAYIINSIGDVYSTSDGISLTRLGGPTFVDVGASAGASQFIYALGGSGACKDLYFYNGAGFVQVPGACGTRLDVAPDGTVWLVYAGVIYHLSISGTAFSIIGSYPNTWQDVTVAADGTVWAVNGNLMPYRLQGGAFVIDSNIGGEITVGVSAGSDGDTPYLIQYVGGRLFQRNEDDSLLDDHTVNTVDANTVSYNVAPGTYTITENSPPSPWQLTNVRTAGGTASPNIITRSVTITVTAGQAGYVEFDNAFINSAVVSNSCGVPYVEDFGSAGTTTPTVGPALPNGYTSYHYDPVLLAGGNYFLLNDMATVGIPGKLDHTPGDVGGYMVLINSGHTPDEYFRRRFTGLVPGATYFLSLYAENFTNARIVPNLILEARKIDGSLLASYTSGDILYDGIQWHKYQLEFTADASGTIDFIVRNNQQLLGTDGNDIAIDDITIGVGCDFGDAPDTYKTTLANGGPSHKGSANLRMGTLLDIETDGFPSTANGDNLDNINDEDAVTFGVLCTGSTSLTALVVNVNNPGAPTARIIGWIDFNQNGIFEISEGATIAAGSSGSYTLTWTGISGLVPGTTYARVRLTSDPTITVATPGGSAADGEVEDYQIVINPGGGTITASPTALTTCSGDLVSINYTTSPAGQTVRWVRMPGNVTALGSVSEALSATGTTPTSYTYTAIIADLYGCPSNVATTVVTVNPRPIITPSVCSQTICSGQTGAITFTSSVSATINWLRVEDGATGTGNISQLFATAGTNTYKIWGVSAAPASCPSSTTITCTIVVNNCCDLVANALPTSVTSCLSPNTGSIAITYTGTGTYQYRVNGGAFQALGASPAIITNLAAGSYTIVVQAVGTPTCSQTLVASVNGPVSPVINAFSNSPLCAGSTLSLSATSGLTTYAWSGPNGFVSNLQNPTIPTATTVASGVYSVSVVNAVGCTGSASTTVTIATQPSLSITAGSGLTICSGQSTTLNVGGANNAPVTWTNNLGQSGSGTTINFAGVTNLSGQPQTITYVVSANAGACSDSKTVDIIIKPVPILQVIPQQAVICAQEQTNVKATSTPATATINWTRTPASGSGTGTVTVNETLPAGNYTYTFTATEGGCTSSPVTVPLTVNN